MTATTTATSTRSRRRAATTTASATVDQYDHAAAAAYLMKHAGRTALAVVDGQRPGHPVGCITATDLAAAMAQGTDLNQTRIRDLITHGRAPFARLSASHAPPC